MRVIDLTYKKFFINRHIRTYVPEKWHEMSAEQFMAVVRLYLMKGDIFRFMSEFFNLSASTLIRLDDFQYYKLIDLTSFAMKLTQPHNEFFIHRLKGTKLYAPSPKLNGMTLQQFMTVDTYFNRYAATKKVEFLDKFIATLYIPRGVVFCNVDGEKSPLLNVEKSLDIVSKLDEETKMAAFMNFTLIKNWLSSMFTYLFRESPESARSATSNMQVQWLDIFDSFVGDDVANMKIYQAMEVLSAFRIMNNRIRKSMKK